MSVVDHPRPARGPIYWPPARAKCAQVCQSTPPRCAGATGRHRCGHGDVVHVQVAPSPTEAQWVTRRLPVSHGGAVRSVATSPGHWQSARIGNRPGLGESRIAARALSRLGFPIRHGTRRPGGGTRIRALGGALRGAGGFVTCQSGRVLLPSTLSLSRCCAAEDTAGGSGLGVTEDRPSAGNIR